MRDVGERLARVLNQLPGPLDPARFHERTRRHARGALERAREVIPAEPRTRRQIAELDRPLEIGLDEQLHALQRRRRQAAAKMRVLHG